MGTLSKGQRKRALLAIGMLTPHPLLLVDEPFDGLDLRQTREVGAALRAHAATGRTLFLSIHQIADAARVCDRFVLLSGGRVCARRHDGRTDRRARTVSPSSPSFLPLRGRRSLRLRKTAFLWLLEKEWRELLASRAWWVMLVLIGPLVGVSFISAVRTYAELSGYGGTADGRRRGVFAARRHLGADLQRVRAGGGVPAAVRRDPRRRGRSAERRAEARAAAADAGVLAHRGEGGGADGGLDHRVTAGRAGDRPVAQSTAAASIRPNC